MARSWRRHPRRGHAPVPLAHLSAKSLKNREQAMADFEKALSLAGDNAAFAALVQKAIDDYRD